MKVLGGLPQGGKTCCRGGRGGLPWRLFLHGVQERDSKCCPSLRMENHREHAQELREGRTLEVRQPD